MPYDQVGALGIQRGLITPEEEYNARQIQMAQMAALRQAAGGGMAGGDQTPAPAPTPEADRYNRIDMLNRAAQAQLTHDTALEQLRGGNSLNVVKEQMAPRNREVDLEAQREAQMKPMRDFLQQKRMDLTNEAFSKGRTMDLAGPTQSGAPLTTQTQDGGRFGSADPSDLAAIQMALVGGGQMPDLAKQKAERQMLALKEQQIQQEMEASKQDVADRAANREAAKLQSTGDFGKANEARLSSGQPAQYVTGDTAASLFQTDPELMSELDRLKNISQTNVGFTPAMLSAGDFLDKYSPTNAVERLFSGDKPQENLASYRSGVSANVSGQIQKLIDMAKSKGIDPRQALSYYLQQIRPQMGATYLPDQNRK